MRQFVVIGLGRFGFSVAKTLSVKGHQVLGIDIDEDRVQDLSEIATQAVCADATDEKALKAIGMENIDVAVVGMGDNIEASILTTLVLKELGIKEIVAKAVSEDHRKVLQRVGATKVVAPEKDMGIRVANSLISPAVIEHIELSEDSSIVELIPPGEYINKSLRDIDIRKRYGLNIIAIKKKMKIVSKEGEVKEEHKINVAPEPGDMIRKEDILIVVGTNEHIEEFKKRR
ncbi:MAG: TrkA family potassium uptake protein [Candidatus Omnitrophica bacterium]|nr:TrkA family potassium uptake protein [Candidatus Omnitrophota bacterium]